MHVGSGRIFKAVGPRGGLQENLYDAFPAPPMSLPLWLAPHDTLLMLLHELQQLLNHLGLLVG